MDCASLMPKGTPSFLTWAWGRKEMGVHTQSTMNGSGGQLGGSPMPVSERELRLRGPGDVLAGDDLPGGQQQSGGAPQRGDSHMTQASHSP